MFGFCPFFKGGVGIGHLSLEARVQNNLLAVGSAPRVLPCCVSVLVVVMFCRGHYTPIINEMGLKIATVAMLCLRFSGKRDVVHGYAAQFFTEYITHVCIVQASCILLR